MHRTFTPLATTVTLVLALSPWLPLPATPTQPYSADAETLALYHFEEPANDFERNGDPGNPITNLGSKGVLLNLTITGGPDGKDNKGLGGYQAPGAPGMGYAFNIIESGNGRYHDDPYPQGGGIRTSTPIAQSDLQGPDGAFTYEALISFNELNLSHQILSMDSATGIRGFSFRISAEGNLAFFGGSDNPEITAPIPTNGDHAFVPNTWFHVAACYNGDAAKPNNLKLYWSRLGVPVLEANLIGSGSLSHDLPDSLVPLHVGTTARLPFRQEMGVVDEVRISRVARNSKSFLVCIGANPTNRLVKFDVQVNAPRQAIPLQLYGQFMEDFGHAFEEGLHAEIIRGMGFEGNDFTKEWKFFSDPSSSGTATAINTTSPNGSKCLEIAASSGTVGIRQSPLSIAKNRPYAGSIWLQNVEGTPKTTLRLRSERNQIIASTELPSPGLEWKEIPFVISSPTQSRDAILELAVTGPGKIQADFLTLMAQDDAAAAQTRKDLREGVSAIQPSFIRFPGGSHASRYHWKDGIGKRLQRPYGLNESWVYPTYNLFGTDEFMNVCELLRAEPLIVFNATDHHLTDLSSRSPTLLQDSLDWIEYLTGPPTSPWGAKRAANGHPLPWRVPYFQIDNEPMNYQMSGKDYAALVNHWAPQIRSAAPQSKLIACGQKRDYDLAFSKQVIDLAGSNFDVLGVHNYEYVENAYQTGVRRIGNYLKSLRDHILKSANPRLKIGVLEWGMSVGKSSMDWRSGLHAAGSLMLYESMPQTISMSCPAIFIRKNGYTRWGYGSSLMFDHATCWPSGAYAVGKLFRENYQPHQLAYLEGDVDAIATLSQDGSTVVIKAVNYSAQASKLQIHLSGVPITGKRNVAIQEISAPPTAECTSNQPKLFTPAKKTATYLNGIIYKIPPYGVSVLTIPTTPPSK